MIFQRVYVLESDEFGLFQYYNPTTGSMVSNTVHIEFKNPLAMQIFSSIHDDHSDTSISLEFRAQHLDQIASAWLRARTGELPAYFRSAE